MKKRKKHLEMSPLFTCTKNHDNMTYASWDMDATGIIFCHFGPFFALLPHYWPQKLTFGKNVKKTWRYYPFTNVYHKYRSYDVWFLRYKATTNRGFCHFDPPNNPKNPKILKKWKEQLETLSFYTCVPCFPILDHFLPFYPLMT